MRQQRSREGHLAGSASLLSLSGVVFSSCCCCATAKFLLLWFSAWTGGVEEKEEKALETPRADPEKQDYCWTEKFPSELGVEMHASKILNRDAEGVFSKF